MRLIGPFFPGGRAGAGLLLIRISVGGSLLIAASASNFPSFRLPAALLLSVPIMIGYGTRMVAVLSICLIGYLHMLGHAPALGSLPGIVTALALICTGPGAFSVDAHAFGRSTIVMARRRNSERVTGQDIAGDDPPDRGA